jgi:hypothetical protein
LHIITKKKKESYVLKLDKKAKISAICGVVAVSVLGTLLHFLYEWTGENTFVALFSGVNESTWEHLKLFYMPFLLYALIEFAIYGKKLENFFTVKLLSAIAGMAFTVVSYYTYTGVIGKNFAWLNIAIFYISVIIAFVCSYYFLIKEPISVSGTAETLSAIALVIIAALFFVFTFYPPDIALFKDPSELTAPKS